MLTVKLLLNALIDVITIRGECLDATLVINGDRSAIAKRMAAEDNTEVLKIDLHDNESLLNAALLNAKTGRPIVHIYADCPQGNVPEPSVSDRKAFINTVRLDTVNLLLDTSCISDLEFEIYGHFIKDHLSPIFGSYKSLKFRAVDNGGHFAIIDPLPCASDHVCSA